MNDTDNMYADSNKAMPTNQGLQQFSSGINTKYDAYVFETLPITDNTHKDPESGVPIPSAMAVDEAKDWVDNGSKL